MDQELLAADGQTTVETSAKETPAVSQGTESDASENSASKDAGERAGDSRESAEGNRAGGNDGRQRNSWKRTVDQLRASRREERQKWESELGELRSEIQRLNQGISQSGRQSQKQSKTFWEAPEEVMQERIGEQLAALKQELLEGLRNRDTETQQTSQWQAETSEATKFIQSQKGITDDDAEDIAEIVRSTPEMSSMSPMQRARYGLFLWQQQRGITDKSSIKAKATTINGAPPQTSGQKIWTNSEVEAELAKFPKDPKHFTKEQSDKFAAFERELRLAQKQGRVK